jgi:hypothetical protein
MVDDYRLDLLFSVFRFWESAWILHWVNFGLSLIFFSYTSCFTLLHIPLTADVFCDRKFPPVVSYEMIIAVYARLISEFIAFCSLPAQGTARWVSNTDFIGNHQNKIKELLLR